MTASQMFLGLGRRKTAVARVRLKSGTGGFLVNGKPVTEYFPALRDLNEAKAPLGTLEVPDTYDVQSNVHGGGPHAQAGALSLGIARALKLANPALFERQGGVDPAANLKLRYAIEKARAMNMPKEGIERTIKKASGDGKQDEELVYEGYGPGGIALMITALSDNRARTAGDLKNLFEKGGGNMGTPGAVGFMFQHRAILTIERGTRSEDELTELALEVGAEDVRVESDAATILAVPTAFLETKAALEKKGVAFLSAELGYVPLTSVPIADKATAAKLLRLIELLDSNDDVQDVYANYDMPAEWMAELADAAG